MKEKSISESRVAYLSSGAETLMLEKRFTYYYNSNGFITRVLDFDGTNKNYVNYTYDGQGRLTREDIQGYNSYTYAYDAAGNRTSKKTYAYTTGSLAAATKTESYSYDERNRLYDGAYGYDANGNPTKYKYNTLSWTRGRLLASYGSNSYSYNESGIRISKTVS